MIRPAVIEDVPAILQLIRDLADYEHALEEVVATEDSLRSTLFAANPSTFALVAEDEGKVVGLAVWFLSFSTWTGTNGVYLEDLYVAPESRGRGFGKALMGELARICVERNYARFEWSVLDWNAPSIAVYESLGAEPLSEWTRYRLSGEPLAQLAKS